MFKKHSKKVICMVRGVIVKINAQRGASSREVTGMVKREDTGELLPFKSSMSRVPGLGEGDWINGRVRTTERVMTNLEFAQGQMRSGLTGRPKRQ